MTREEVDNLLRESDYFRSVLADLLHSTEQTFAIVTAAVARQVDAGRLAEDILAMQRETAIADPNSVRDRLLSAIRSQLGARRPD